METKKILTILVFVLAPVLTSVAHGKIILTADNQDVGSITLTLGQSCTVEIVSSDSVPYEAYVGFYLAPVIGDFSPLEIKPEAGKGAEVLKYSTPDFRGYHVITGSGINPPSPGVHFVFQFEAKEVGETDVTLYDENFKFKLDSLHITVVPAAMGTVFTYQGRLIHDNNPTDGPYDFEFRLYDGPVGGNQMASTIDINDLDVIDGYFTVELDFNDPNVFNGDACWLDIAVRPGDGSSFTTLSPRQQLTPTPYAIYAANAGSDGDWMVSGDNMYSIPSGRVGIGTMTPYSKLHVEDDTTGNVQITIHNQDNSGSERLLFGTSTAIDAGMLVYGSTNPSNPGKWRFMNNKTSANYDWTTNGSVRMTLANNGYLGIGTETPTYMLHINETDPGHDLHPMIDNNYRHAGLIIDCAENYNSNVLFRENGANKFMIENNNMYDYGLGIYEYGVMGFTTVWKNGRVGIGTTSPSSKLHIEDDTTGEVRLTINNENTSGWESLFFGTSTSDAAMLIYGSTHATSPGKWRFINNKTSGHYDWITSGPGSVQMTLANNGRLGLGTTSPGAGLHLKGTDHPSSFMYLESSNNEDTGFRLYEGTTVKWHIFNESGANGLSIRNNGYSSVLFIEQGTGEVGIGTTSPQTKLDVRGRTRTQVLEITGGSDLSEQFEIKAEEQKVEPGMVVCIDPANCGNLVLSQRAYDRTVAGIVSGAGGVKPGMLMGQQGTMADGEHPVALTGRAYCRADASNGPITPGDLLTTSDVTGHAMKVTDYGRAQGAILGKAMSSLNEGRGLVLVLVTLQ